MYCNDCGKAKPAASIYKIKVNGFAQCTECAFPDITADDKEELKKLNKAAATRSALMQLVKNHREEFTSLVAIEKDKLKKAKKK